MGAFVQRNGSGPGGMAPAQILRGRTRIPTAGEQVLAATQQLLQQSREDRATLRITPVTARKAVAAGAAISLEPTVPGAATRAADKLAAAQCAARGGAMVLGRCVTLATMPAPGVAPGAQAIQSRVPGGPVMGIRAEMISPSFLPTGGGGSPLLAGLIGEGFGLLNTFIESKFGQPGVSSLAPSPSGALIPAGGPVGLAAVSATIVAAGGAIVGSVIRISSRAWAAIPTLIKQAAVALGLTVAFTDVGLADIGIGGGDGLSLAQQKKISRFQAMTSAGVPPGIAARATGIGRKRRRGISAFELRGFRKISHMLGHVGMVPRGLRGARPHRHHHHK